MGTSGADRREVAVPVSVLVSLRTELEREAGTLEAVHALHRAGYAAGMAAAASLHAEAGGDAFAGSERGFWPRLQRYFTQRGWGTLAHRTPHQAIGVLSSTDWAEASTAQVDPDASCCFSTGFLSGLLSQLAGGPVAVLEIECRSRGGASCDFAFGSEGAVHELYGRLLEGSDVDGALAAL